MTRYPTKEELELWRKVNETDLPAFLSVKNIPPFESTLDLHNMTIQDAYNAVYSHILKSYENGYNKILHITGKSGNICKEFPFWIERNKYVRYAESLNGGGSWKITLVKK